MDAAEALSAAGTAGAETPDAGASGHAGGLTRR